MTTATLTKPAAQRQVKNVYLQKMENGWDKSARKIAHAVQNNYWRPWIIEKACEYAFKSGRRHVEVSDVERAFWDSPIYFIVVTGEAPKLANGHRQSKINGNNTEGIDRDGNSYLIRLDDVTNKVYAWSQTNGGLFRYEVI